MSAQFEEYDDEFVKRLTQEVGLALRAGLWESALAPHIPNLEKLRLLCLRTAAPNESAAVIAVCKSLVAAVSAVPASEIRESIRCYAGCTPASYGQRLKVRRRLAAERLSIAPSTFRASYESELIAVVAWSLITNEGPPAEPGVGQSSDR